MTNTAIINTREEPTLIMIVTELVLFYLRSSEAFFTSYYTFLESILYFKLNLDYLAVVLAKVINK